MLQISGFLTFSQIFPVVTYSYWRYDEKMRMNLFFLVFCKGELAVFIDRALLFLVGFCLIVILKTTKWGICAGGEYIDVGKIWP